MNRVFFCPFSKTSVFGVTSAKIITKIDLTNGFFVIREKTSVFGVKNAKKNLYNVLDKMIFCVSAEKHFGFQQVRA